MTPRKVIYPYAATFTSDELRRRPRLAKEAAGRGPVVVTENGKPAFVLATFETYDAVSGNVRHRQLMESFGLDLDTLSEPAPEEIEREPSERG